MREWLSFLTVCSLLLPACESVDCDPAQASACPSMQACLKIGEDQGGPANRCRPVDPNGKVKCTMVGKVDECTADAPICGPNKVCATCQDFAMPDDACKMATSAKPYCKLAANMSPALCVQCTGEGPSSVGCSASTPTCDSKGKCGPCTKHSDCATGLCRLAEYGLQPGGTCADDIAYVGKTNCLDAGTGTKVQPYCEITPAIASNRPFIVVDSGTFAGFTVSGGNRVLLGKGREPTGTLINGPVVVSASATFWMEGVRLSLPANVMNVNAAVSCQTGASLTVAKSVVEGAPLDIPGISEAVTCTQLTVLASHIRGNGGPGIVIETGRKYSIVNSLIAENNSGISLGMNAQGTFQFNTVRSNNLSGVECKSNQLLDSSIIVNNGGFGVMTQGLKGCTFAASHVGSMADTDMGLIRADPPEFVGSAGAADNFKLKPASTNNLACCIDRSENTSVKTDYFGTARPKGIKADIGFHEVQ